MISEVSSNTSRWNFRNRPTWVGDMAVWSCSGEGRCKISQKHVFWRQIVFPWSNHARRISISSHWRARSEYSLRFGSSRHYCTQTLKFTICENVDFGAFWRISQQRLLSAAISHRIRDFQTNLLQKNALPLRLRRIRNRNSRLKLGLCRNREIVNPGFCHFGAQISNREYHFWNQRQILP